VEASGHDEGRPSTDPVTDLVRSRAWYVTTLGLKVECGARDRQTVALQNSDGFAIFLQQPPSAIQPRAARCGFGWPTSTGRSPTGSSEASSSRTLPEKTYWGYGAALQDPDGYLIRLWDEHSMKENSHPVVAFRHG